MGEEELRKGLEEALSTRAPKIIDGLVSLGFGPANVEVLYLVPAIQVAWADGKIQRAEKNLLLEKARARHYTEVEMDFLNKLLKEKPDPSFFRRAVRVISTLYDEQSRQVAAKEKRDLLKLCEEVANAAGGIPFLRKSGVSDEEREAINSISKVLNLRNTSLNRVSHDKILSVAFDMNDLQAYIDDKKKDD